ncbi:MAG TPA: hypothetical protein EYN91_08970 [Candidatus Melainabacteria bacterium]|nr:hypothetical protein [Candidatus Melainabacteria bacterium]HIN66983.1 hypothetical protein [Candidatus Obscuribacterales bacterium]
MALKEICIGFPPKLLKEMTDEAEKEGIPRTDLIRDACVWYMRFVKFCGPVLRAYAISLARGKSQSTRRPKRASTDLLDADELSDGDGVTELDTTIEGLEGSGDSSDQVGEVEAEARPEVHLPDEDGENDSLREEVEENS